jgi:hypothetical protein
MALTIRTSRGDDYISASVTTSGSVAMAHYWYLDGEEWDVIQTEVGETKSSCYFDGLDPGTTYKVEVKVYAYNPWRLLDSGSKSVTTTGSLYTTYYAKLILDGNGGKLNNGSTTSTYTGNAESERSYAYVDIDFNVSFVRSGYTFLGFSTDEYATEADYAKSDTYSIRATSTSSSRPTTEYLYAVWKAKRPSNWSWSSTVSKGAAIPYTQSGNAITCKPLTASEWNNFIDRIFEFMEYQGLSWSGDTSDFYATKGSRMLAETVDYARQLIAVMNPPTALPSAIRSGGKITAAFINGLKNSLNSIP